MSRAGKGHKRARAGSGPTAVAIALALLGSAAVAPARAEDASNGSGSLWNKVLGTLDLRTDTGNMPDFVKETHPDVGKLKYMPTTAPHVARPLPVKSADDVEATKQALDAARDAQLNPHPAVKHKPVKGKPKTAQN